MAVTRGHGNPHWTREEVILALDLYFEFESSVPGPSNPRVKQLSDLLRVLPHHSVAAREETFRNPAGVAFKLQNLRQVATGRGLANVSQVDRQVWEEFGSEPARVRRQAGLIRAGIELIEQEPPESDDEDVFHEGRTVTEAHKRRERNPRLRKLLLKQRRRQGDLQCEICSLSTSCDAGSVLEAIFETHHIVPLAEEEERVTRLKDLALLCANCHRMVHRAISKAGRWMTVEELTPVILGHRRDGKSVPD